MLSIVIFLIIASIPLWTCALHASYVMGDDLSYSFEGWQPKAALALFSAIIFIVYFLPMFLDAQYAASASRRASRLFTLIPSIGAAMVIFPETVGSLTGLEKAGVGGTTIRKLYRSLGWLFLGGVFVLIWVL